MTIIALKSILYDIAEKDIDIVPQKILGVREGGKVTEGKMGGEKMKKGRNRGRRAKNAVLVAAAVFGTCCLMAGCQATPETQAVVNKADSAAAASTADWTQQASGEAAAAGAGSGQTSAEPAVYVAGEHWSETVQPDEHFTVTADVDLQVPNTDQYPMLKIHRGEISQEQATQIVSKLMGDAELYQLPIVTTKAEYEQEILALRQTMAEDQANDDEDAVRADEEALSALEAAYQEAPEKAERVPADCTFTYQRDFDGQPVEEGGEQFVDVYSKTDDGVASLHITARGMSEAEGPSVQFWKGSYVTQSLDERNASSMERDTPGMDNPWAKPITDRLATYASHPVDLDAAKEKAQQILTDLGIPDALITSAEKGYFAKDTNAPDDAIQDDGSGYDVPCAVLTFAFSSGGIPCTEPQVTVEEIATVTEGAYSAPFGPQVGSIILDESGDVLGFTWNNPVVVTEEVQKTQEILPFDEVKSRITDQLLYQYGYPAESPRIDLGFTVDEAQLVMAYINAEGDPQSALTVPAWRVQVHGTGPYFDDPQAIGEDGVILDPDWPYEIFVNAVDGSPIFPAGMPSGDTGSAK